MVFPKDVQAQVETDRSRGRKRRLWFVEGNRRALGVIYLKDIVKGGIQ